MGISEYHFVVLADLEVHKEREAQCVAYRIINPGSGNNSERLAAGSD